MVKRGIVLVGEM
jgi:hypothetical protein